MGKVKTTVKKVSLKKEMKQKIALQLTSSLEELKLLLGEKKFSTRIRKATSLLSAGIKVKAGVKDKAGKKTGNVHVAENNVAVAS